MPSLILLRKSSLTSMTRSYSRSHSISFILNHSIPQRDRSRRDHDIGQNGQNSMRQSKSDHKDITQYQHRSDPSRQGFSKKNYSSDLKRSEESNTKRNRHSLAHQPRIYRIHISRRCCSHLRHCESIRPIDTQPRHSPVKVQGVCHRLPHIQSLVE